MFAINLLSIYNFESKSNKLYIQIITIAKCVWEIKSGLSLSPLFFQISRQSWLHALSMHCKKLIRALLRLKSTAIVPAMNESDSSLFTSLLRTQSSQECPNVSTTPIRAMGFLLVSKTFPGFPALGVQNLLKGSYCVLPEWKIREMFY